MVDVGYCLNAFALLMPMFISGEGERLEWQFLVFFLGRLGHLATTVPLGEG
jgi:hypothetical protein